jgi:hypothetical protein
MNKNVLLFFTILFSISLAAMDGDGAQFHADHKVTVEKKSSKKKKSRSDVPAPVSPSAAQPGALAPAPLAQPVPVAVAKPAPSKDQDADADEVEGDLVPIASQSIIEVELDPVDRMGFIQQKATNFVLGTHNTLLARLRSLKANEIVSKSLANQGIILSAVKNLVELCGAEHCILKKAGLDDIAELLKYAELRKDGKPVITLDKGPADSLKEFLDAHQKKLFATFYALYLEQIKPVRQIAGLIDSIDTIGGNKPQADVNLTSLSHINMQALDKIMSDMAGVKAAAQQDDKKDK